MEMAQARRTLALLLLVCLAMGARPQALPPQCDPMVVFYPQSLVFMGPVQSIQAGKGRIRALAHVASADIFFAQ